MKSKTGVDKLTKRFGDGRVFDGAGDEMSRRIAALTEESEIVGLGGAAGENHFVGVSAEQRGDALASIFQTPARARPA